MSQYFPELYGVSSVNVKVKLDPFNYANKILSERSSRC